MAKIQFCQNKECYEVSKKPICLQKNKQKLEIWGRENLNH